MKTQKRIVYTGEGMAIKKKSQTQKDMTMIGAKMCVITKRTNMTDTAKKNTKTRQMLNLAGK